MSDDIKKFLMAALGVVVGVFALPTLFILLMKWLQFLDAYIVVK